MAREFMASYAGEGMQDEWTHVSMQRGCRTWKEFIDVCLPEIAARCKREVKDVEYRKERMTARLQFVPLAVVILGGCYIIWMAINFSNENRRGRY